MVHGAAGPAQSIAGLSALLFYKEEANLNALANPSCLYHVAQCCGVPVTCAMPPVLERARGRVIESVRRDS